MHDETIIDQYVRWLEKLAKGGTHRIAMYTAKDIRYRTPAAEGVGVEAVAAIFASVFDGAVSVKTKVSDRALGQDGHTVYLRWDRLVTTPSGQVHGMSGVSELMTGMDGKIVSIIDHWDSLPQGRTGFLSRFFKR